MAGCARCGVRGADRRCMVERVLYRRVGVGDLLPRVVDDHPAAMGDL